MKTKSKLREKLLELHKKYSIDWELQDEQFFDDAIQAFSEELDKLEKQLIKHPLDYNKWEENIRLGYDWGRNNSLSAIKEMKDRLLK